MESCLWIVCLRVWHEHREPALFEQLNLDLLDLEQPIVLATQQVVDFFVQVPNLKFGFQIDFVIVLRP